MTNVGSCAATGGTNYAADSSPTDCWALCMQAKHRGFWKAIVWRYGDCGCVAKKNLGTCDVGTSNDYEYHESDPALCGKNQTIFTNLHLAKNMIIVSINLHKTHLFCFF